MDSIGVVLCAMELGMAFWFSYTMVSAAWDRHIVFAYIAGLASYYFVCQFFHVWRTMRAFARHRAAMRHK